MGHVTDEPSSAYCFLMDESDGTIDIDDKKISGGGGGGGGSRKALAQ